MSLPNPTIALVAGETSGDQLGAALVEKLAERYPGARFVGIAGDKMQAAGVEAWWHADELAVMGLFEVLSHLPRLLRLRKALVKKLLEVKHDVLIGIDAPDFNLGLEIKARRAGIKTVHYVSPTIWAWREKRVKKIARAADLVLCLFPFEPAFYRDHAVPASYVGHPLADQIETNRDPGSARVRLGLQSERTTVALLPGSRLSEVSRLAEPMIEAARLLSRQHADIQFVAAMAKDSVETEFRSEMQRLGFDAITLVRHDPRSVIAAGDVVICASGTATLEVMLVNRPMVMTYRLSPSTYRLGKLFKLVKLQWFSLPNILANEELVPELIQDEASADRLAQASDAWLKDSDRVRRLQTRFQQMHESLRCGAGAKAADAVAKLLETPRQ